MEVILLDEGGLFLPTSQDFEAGKSWHTQKTGRSVGWPECWLWETGNTGAESLMVSGLWRQAQVWTWSYKQWRRCRWGFKAQWWHKETTVSDGPPLFQNCFLLSSGSWSWGIAVKFPFWGNGSPDSIPGSAEDLKGNAQSISIPYSFLPSKMYFPCVLVSTPFSFMSWGKWLKPSVLWVPHLQNEHNTV